MAQFTIYNSTDAGAPVLTGQAGSLTTLLDACLVNGYGAKAAAGWAKVFTGTNKAVYRAPTGSRMYLRVAADGQSPNMRGYEAMTDVDTGTGVFPTTAQQSSGVCLRTSASSDTTARPWRIFADERTIYLFAKSGDVAGVWSSAMFGEIYSFKANDAYNCLIAGRERANVDGTYPFIQYEMFPALGGKTATSSWAGSQHLTTVVESHFMPRSYVQSGSSIAVAKHGDPLKGGQIAYTYLAGTYPVPGFFGVLPFPNGPDGGIFLSPVYVVEPTTKHIRGRLRGVYQWLHSADAAVDGDTFTGAGDFAGKTFMVNGQFPTYTAEYKGLIIVETSNTLDTN